MRIYNTHYAFDHVVEMVKEHYGDNPMFDNTLMIFGYNLPNKYQKEPLVGLIAREKASGTHVIIYQLEQLYNGSHWVLKDTIMLLKMVDEIWDYYFMNIEFLYDTFNVTAKLRPMMYTKSICNLPVVENSKKDIDVLFYGSMNNRREKILTHIQKTIDPKKIYFDPNVWGKDLDDLVSRSKVVLNLHYFPTVRQEQVRMFYLVSNGVCVLSEESENNYMGNSILNVSTENLDMVCQQLLLTGKWMNMAASAADKYRAVSLNYKKKIKLQ